MRPDFKTMMLVYRHIELANMFSTACRKAVVSGKASAAQLYASAAARQRRLTLELLIPVPPAKFFGEEVGAAK